MATNKEIKVFEVNDLVKADNSFFNSQQIQQLFERTPAKKVKVREGKGGQKWKYVDGSYVILVLNLLFGFEWDFEVKTSTSEMLAVAEKTGSVVCLGRFTGKKDGKVIIKEDYGRADVKKLKDGSGLVDFGNDCKAAKTDALKRCAVSLGLFNDVYNPDNFKAIEISQQEGKSRIADRMGVKNND